MTMRPFRKKPVVIHAVQWWPSMGSVFGVELQEPDDDYGIIRTLEGSMVVSAGDWVIQGVKNELYPCKPDIFAMTYEEVDPE